MTDEIAKIVYKVLADNIVEPIDDVNADTVLKLVGLGSLEVVETIFDLEEAFDITIPNPGESADIDTGFETAGDIVVAVKQLMELESD